MVREFYDQELSQLKEDILLMSVLVEKMVENAVSSLVNKDIDIAKAVIEEDDVIDAKEIEIQQMIVEIIARQQPVATDLRVIASAFKVINNLERIADKAVDIARVTIDLIDEPYMKELVDIPRMGELCIKMVNVIINSYINEDTSSFEEVIKMENTVDDLNRQIYHECIFYMIEDNKNIRQASKLLFVASYLERIGDHATNLFETVYYIVTGKYADIDDIELED
jgi:phosphate transport system protein